MSLFNKKECNISKYRIMNFIAPLDIDYIHDQLKDNINKEMNLELLLDQFFSMCHLPTNSDYDLLYACSDIENIDGKTIYILSFIRQVIINDKYSVIELDIKYDINDLPCIFKPINICDLDVKQDFYDFIKETKQFKLLQNLKIKNIDLLFSK